MEGQTLTQHSNDSSRKPLRRRQAITKNSVQRIADDAAAAAAPNGFVPKRVAEVTLVTQATWTTGSFIPIYAQAPKGARWAIIQFFLQSTADVDDYEMFWDCPGKVDDPQRTVLVKSGEDDHRPRMNEFVDLDGAGYFRYKVLANAGGPNGSIKLVGYVM